MSQVQEFELHDPEMMIDRFYVEIPQGDEWQRWVKELWSSEELEFFYEAEQAWLPATVQRSYIDDGSGNAPGDNADYWLLIERDGKRYRLRLDRGLRVRLEAPTIEELKARTKSCEQTEVKEEETRYNPAIWGPCHKPVTRKVAGSWYCEEHATNLEESLAKYAKRG